MLFLYPLVMQFLPSRKPGKRLKKARLPLSCIIWWVWTIFPLQMSTTSFQRSHKSATWIYMPLLFRLSVIPLSATSPWSAAIRAALQASHSSEIGIFIEVLRSELAALKLSRAKPSQSSEYSMAPCHTSNCALNSSKMTAREMWQYFSWDAACQAKIQSTASWNTHIKINLGVLIQDLTL